MQRRDFSLIRQKMSKLQGSELDEFGISHMSVGNRMKLKFIHPKSCLLHGRSCLTVVRFIEKANDRFPPHQWCIKNKPLKQHSKSKYYALV